MKIKSRQTFVRSAFDKQLLNECEYGMIMEMYSKTEPQWKDNIHVYIKTNPEKCLSRVKLRGRHCEHTVSLAYLTDLHNKHEDAVRSCILSGRRVIRISAEGRTVADIGDEIYRHLISDKSSA